MVRTDVAELLERSGAGDRRALARLLTVVEDGDDASRRALLALLPRGPVRTVGMTGAPGVGKSTLTAALVGALRAQGRRVAVLAVDPSSPLTGGALLGDRIRMQGHHADEGVYVRSMASRGQLGGLSAAVPLAVLVLGASGFDDVLVETVGVGQSEVDVAALADVTVLVLAPGLGDGVQAAKAGVLEVADVLVVNRADRSGVEALEAELAGMLELGRLTGAVDGDVPVLRTVAVNGEGVPALAAAIETSMAARRGSSEAGEGSGSRVHQRARRLVLALVEGEVRRLLSAPDAPGAQLLARAVADVAEGELDAVHAAQAVVLGLADLVRNSVPSD
jgi:LAO/AO transport system kinase